MEFKDYAVLTDGVIDLVLEASLPANEAKGYVPTYKYKICLHNTVESIGEIDIRLGANQNTYYGGNIGYGIHEAHRGHSYAVKACQVIRHVALDHQMGRLIITCNPDNWPSRRTCEKLGLALKEIVDLPQDNDMYLEGERQKCIYEWVL